MRVGNALKDRGRRQVWAGRASSPMASDKGRVLKERFLEIKPAG